ncbi:hypothetical protein K1719_013068 [Acacia pycnantha]|nr:hypothetical protein K1719_013068 [Acacia pycnantha]
MAVALGGRVAEEVIFGEDNVTTGASNDFMQVSRVAKQMVERSVTSWKRLVSKIKWEAFMASQAASSGAYRKSQMVTSVVIGDIAVSFEYPEQFTTNNVDVDLAASCYRTFMVPTYHNPVITDI